MPTLDNENEVVSAAKEGDSEAFTALVHNHANEIYRLCYRLSGNPTDAEDISQEVFVRVFKSIKKFNQESSFSTWIHRIAVNRWIDIARRRKKIKYFSIDGQPDPDRDETRKREIPDSKPVPEKLVENKELQETVRKSLNTLTPEQKVAIILKYKEGKSLEEISKICDSSIGTVSSRISRGIKEMKKNLKKYII